MSKQLLRPRFTPEPWNGDDQSSPRPLVSSTDDEVSAWARLWSVYPLCYVSSLSPRSIEKNKEPTPWIPLIRCSADFPMELFEIAISQLIHHPEYNSTLILRSEVVSDSESKYPPSVPRLHGLRSTRTIHRKLLPRRPGRDSGLEQHCTLYAALKRRGKPEPVPSVLVLTPIVETGSELPYYHPKVSHLAFRYIPTDVEASNGILQVEVVPLTDTPTDVNSRLYRTCLALLETLHRYGWGAMTNYKKRVIHDCIVPREPYQDLYLVMRERHKHLVDTWQESTDPLKHVFEDIGIATYLMLLWKDMYAPQTSWRRIWTNPLETAIWFLRDLWGPWTSVIFRRFPSHMTEGLQNEPWKRWPRPPTGFLDLGCGNGLLTHILTAEGYDGHGIDLRARMSWSHYPESTQAKLHVEALDPTTLSSNDPSSNGSYLKPGVFIIGNHADELTPWVPVLSTLCNASGFLNIPCCPWTFDAKYERSSTPNFSTDLSPTEFAGLLKLGGDGSNSSAYSMYRIWLGTLTYHCGWKVESETLRIPSTRNWALVGRERGKDTAAARTHVEEIIEGVQERGIFKTRRPEGKAGDH
ncbi:unnamed protein product [Somion occarium]|uniref:tRNA (uracil-O(2)-)-methyltransferase n=1 Tax=Somion occarium TaxID=3059160 RepID=A0ABP1CLE1_9APHY